jgi:hypothetical protein
MSHEYYLRYVNRWAAPSGSAIWGVGLDRLDAEIVVSNPFYGMDSPTSPSVLCAPNINTHNMKH